MLNEAKLYHLLKLTLITNSCILHTEELGILCFTLKVEVIHSEAKVENE